MRRVGADDVKLHDMTRVKVKTAGNTQGVQFTAGNNKSCPVRNVENCIVSKTVDGIGTVTYQYDIPMGNGEVKEVMIAPDGAVKETVYDAVGRVSKVAGSRGETVQYVYNANGSCQATVYEDGTREDYVYDASGNVITVKHTDRHGTLLDVYEYEYDIAGNLTKETSRYGTTTYVYDADRRLQSVTEPGGKTTTYSYDRAGNRAQKEVSYPGSEPIVTEYTYNVSNQLLIQHTSDGTITEYTYDANGSLISEECTIVLDSDAVTGSAIQVASITLDEPEVETSSEAISGSAIESPTESVTGSAIRYTYDAFNRLTQYETDDVFAVYSYNAEDYRVGKTILDDSGAKNVLYFYEGSRAIMEADAAGNITAHNLYGTNLISRSVQGEGYYYLYNAHGDVVMLMDTSTGAVAATYRYDAFGNVIAQTGNPDNSITYAGYQYDEETGLYYLNARYYNSNTARFLTEDTYRGRQQDPLSLNRYTYCHNNPLIYWDPTGHAARKYKEDYFYSVTTGQRHPKCEIGSAGSYVYQMEQMLEYAGSRAGDSEDGIFDGNTLNAVRLFQRDNNLNVTGIVEQKAWAYLQIQPQLKELENCYNCNSISKEEYEERVFGLKHMVNRVPYKYDDKTLEVADRKMYALFEFGLSIGISLLDLQVMVLTMGASEMIGDGADLLYDLPKAIVNPNPDTVGSVAYDSICFLLPDGPLNFADNVDDIADLGKRAGKTNYGKSSSNSEISQLLTGRPELTGTNREKLLSTIQDSKLASLVNELYRSGALVGDGGTADKLIAEFYEGSSQHLLKAKGRLTEVNRLIDSGTLGLNDLDIAEALRDDLKNAIDLFR